MQSARESRTSQLVALSSSQMTLNRMDCFLRPALHAISPNLSYVPSVEPIAALKTGVTVTVMGTDMNSIRVCFGRKFLQAVLTY